MHGRASCLYYCTPAPVNIDLFKVYGETNRRIQMSPLCSRYTNFWANLAHFCSTFTAGLNIYDVVGKIFNDLSVKYLFCELLKEISEINTIIELCTAIILCWLYFWRGAMHRKLMDMFSFPRMLWLIWKFFQTFSKSTSERTKLQTKVAILPNTHSLLDYYIFQNSYLETVTKFHF